MMRHALPVTKNLVPEWKFCYYNYQILQQLVDMLEKLCKLHSIIRRDYIISYGKTQKPDEEEERQQPLGDCQEIMKNIKICHQHIVKFREVELRVIFIFACYKNKELKNKIMFYRHLTSFFPIGDESCLTLIENVYIQNVFLEKLVLHSISKDSKILKLTNIVSRRFNELNYVHPDRSVERISKAIKSNKDQVNQCYLQRKSEKPSYEEKKQIKQLPNYEEKLNYTHFVEFGIAFGLCIYALAYLIILLEINGISYHTNETFRNTFPVWRGIVSFIVFFWLIGLVFLVFEYFQINYKRIMQVGSHAIPEAKPILVFVSFITFVYLLCYITYVYGLLTDMKNPSGVAFGFYITFLFVLFLPLSFSSFSKIASGRTFTQAVILKMFASPYTGVDYCSNWLSEQMTSFKLAFQDISEAILFFIFGPTECNKDIAKFMGAIFGTSMFLLRICQASKKLYDHPNISIGLPPFRGILKCTLGIATIWCSFVYGYYKQIKDKQMEDQWLYAFCAIGGTSTLYAYYFDIFHDWQVLIEDCACHKCPFLPIKVRNHRLYRPWVYILIGIINFALRISWTLSISSQVVESIFQDASYLFTMILAIFQLVRRALWNILFLQKEHIKACQSFSAVVNYDNIEKQLLRRCKIYEKDSQIDRIHRQYRERLQEGEYEKKKLRSIIDQTKQNQITGKASLKVLKKVVEKFEKKYKKS